MPKAGALLISFKSFFKVSRDARKKTEEVLSVATPHAALASESDDKASAPPPASGLSPSQSVSPLCSSPVSSNGGKASSPRVIVPKGVHRKLLSRPFFPSRSPLSTLETAIFHSISEPFENPPSRPKQATRKDNCRPVGPMRPPAKSSRLVISTRDGDGDGDGDGVMLSSTDTTPCATYDSSRRCLSLDIPAMAPPSPALPGPQLQLHKMVASADIPFKGQASGLSSSACNRSIDALVTTDSPPLQPFHTPQPESTLLAQCPGIPAAMRRHHWCVEDFNVVRRVYNGATSTVYKATCRHSGLPVALKVYNLAKVPKNVIHMIVREIKIHVELVHRHIAKLYGAFSDQKRLVLVQEYAGRGDLHGVNQFLNRRMTEAQVTYMVLAPLMEALSYLHSRGICHRDIKPENILFTNDWRLLVADFGVSIDLNQERAVTRAGTLEYMAPEVERCPLKMLPEDNKENVDLSYTTAVDIWAVGVLAYELMVGFAPFVGSRPFTVATAAADGTTANGPGGGGLLQQGSTNTAARRAVNFPSFISPRARDFISLALAESAEERPTALQLSRHRWLAGTVQQQQQQE